MVDQLMLSSSIGACSGHFALWSSSVQVLTKCKIRDLRMLLSNVTAAMSTLNCALH